MTLPPSSSPIRRLLAWFVATIVVGLVLATCSNPPSGPTGSHNLADSHWEATYISGIGEVFDSITLDITVDSIGHAAGYTCCNWYYSDLEKLSTSQIRFSMIAQTERACGTRKMDIEDAYKKSLITTRTYKRAEFRLDLYDSTGAVVVRYIRLNSRGV